MTQEMIFFLIVAICFIGAGIYLVYKINQMITRTTSNIKQIARTIPKHINMVKDVAQIIQEAESVPIPKSIGGATNTLLPKIQKDFPDFHNPDAEEAIFTFLSEYLKIQYLQQNDFIKSKIDKNLIYNIQKKSQKTIYDMKINKITIYNYEKTSNYATITYKISMGYTVGEIREEKAYEIKYTLQLKTDEINTQAYKCKNCNAPLSTTDLKCPYCDVDIIRDTIMNIKEI